MSNSGQPENVMICVCDLDTAAIVQIGTSLLPTIIGVEPKSLDMGMELSPEVQAKVSRIIELVLEEVNRPSS